MRIFIPALWLCLVVETFCAAQQPSGQIQPDGCFENDTAYNSRGQTVPTIASIEAKPVPLLAQINSIQLDSIERISDCWSSSTVGSFTGGINGPTMGPTMGLGGPSSVSNLGAPAAGSFVPPSWGAPYPYTSPYGLNLNLIPGAGSSSLPMANDRTTMIGDLFGGGTGGIEIGIQFNSSLPVAAASSMGGKRLKVVPRTSMTF